MWDLGGREWGVHLHELPVFPSGLSGLTHELPLPELLPADTCMAGPVALGPARVFPSQRPTLTLISGGVSAPSPLVLASPWNAPRWRAVCPSVTRHLGEAVSCLGAGEGCGVPETKAPGKLPAHSMIGAQ